MKVIQNCSDKDTAKIRLPRKYIEEHKYSFEEYVKVTIQITKNVYVEYRHSVTRLKKEYQLIQ